MIIHSPDLSAEITSNVTVCIVGGGAAGLTLACELDGGDFKVLLLEAGGFKPSEETQDYYRGDASAPHPAAADYRRVAFGGTTSIWGGRCVPFDPIDFERRDYVANSGWPITYREIADYYPRALEYCDAGRFDFTASGSIADGGATIAGLNPDGILETDLIERYSLPTDFGKRYRERIRRSANVTAVLGARCTALNKAAGADRIAGVQVVLQSGERRSITANLIVLASGGIEATRLLLASDADGAGFGNRSDHLGRYYSCHLESSFGKLIPNGSAVAFDFEKTRDGVYCRRKLQFSPAAQRRHQLLNTAFRLHFPEYSDASHGSSVMSSIYLAKSFLISEYRNILQHDAEFAVTSPDSEHWRNVLSGIPQLCRFAVDWIFRRQLAERKLPYTLVANADGSFPLEFNCEQTPLESSRITLLGDTDTHGMRRIHVGWRRSDADIVAVRRAFTLLRETLERSGTCRLEFDDARLGERMTCAAPLGGHHLGTARMAASAATGVVDANCAVFDLPNLFVASSAVFPTGGHANPTLTIVALAVRMAAHLKSLTRRANRTTPASNA
jgi:choline dehydrogenase-like flavoprotein